MSRRARRVAAFVAAAGFAACQNPAAIDAVIVSVFVTPRPVAAGDTVLIIVEAANPTDRTLSLRFESECQFLYRIVDANDLPVGPTSPWFCLQSQTTLVLDPYTVGSASFDWVAQVAAGTYRVYGYLGEDRLREAGPVMLPVQ